jgi:hypothetical protein
VIVGKRVITILHAVELTIDIYFTSYRSTRQSIAYPLFPMFTILNIKSKQTSIEPIGARKYVRWWRWVRHHYGGPLNSLNLLAGPLYSFTLKYIVQSALGR